MSQDSITPRRSNPILDEMVKLLSMEQLEVNLFRGQSQDLGGKSVFGGQVLGQALMAATRTIELDEDGKVGVAHSLHAYFLRPGDMEAPIVYDVERIRDGRTFHVRRVKAIQHGRPILMMMCSFQEPEDGLEHQSVMPTVTPPEELVDDAELRKEWAKDCPESFRERYLRPLAIEFRHVKPRNLFRPEVSEPQQNIWFRAAGRLPDDPVLHRCVLTYATDFNLLSTAMLPHGVSYLKPKMVVASLDHALYFHHDTRADDWLLYSMDSPASQGARGLSRGNIFNRDGLLVASVAQESLMRKV